MQKGVKHLTFLAPNEYASTHARTLNGLHKVSAAT